MTGSKPNRMYLVVVRTYLDELPILLTQSPREAIAKARSVADAEADEAANMMGVDYAGRVNSAVIAFVDGKPARLKIVRDWDAGEERAAA